MAIDQGWRQRSNSIDFAALEANQIERCFLWTHAPSGLRAVLIIDSTALGPAAGGVRTRTYQNEVEAMRDAARLARAMTIKCALGGLDAGGAKAVVMDHSGLDRPRAFARLGELVAELGGLFRTAGDLGTTAADLEAMAARCPYVHTNERDLAASVARGLLGCVRACAERRERGLEGLRVAVQGAGSIGSAVAGVLAHAGCHVIIADIDRRRAEEVAAATGAAVVGTSEIFFVDADVIAPCAVGGVVTREVAERLRAWAVCGAANNILAGEEVAAVLADRDILWVPDVVASAGAVVDGIGETVMGLADRGSLIDGLGLTAAELLSRSAQTGRTTSALAVERAQRRIELATPAVSW